MNHPDHPYGWIVGVLGSLFGSGGVWAWLRERAKAGTSAPADMLASNAELVTAINKQVEGLLKGLHDEIERLKGEVTKLKEENEHCRGENRQMKQRIDSLQAWLRKHGLAIPERALEGNLLTIEGEKVTLQKPRRRTRPR